MKILVCVKQVPEKDARLRIAGDESWIVEDGLGYAISECDRYGVEAALRLKEDGEAEVVVLSLGGDRASKGIKEALAMGCDRAIHVNTDALLSADAITIAIPGPSEVRQVDRKAANTEKAEQQGQCRRISAGQGAGRMCDQRSSL